MHQKGEVSYSLRYNMYVELVKSLTQLHAACVWEHLMLQMSLPEKWKAQTEPKPLMLRRVNGTGAVEMVQESRWDAQPNVNSNVGAADANGAQQNDQEERFAIKNARTVRYLLNQTPHGIESFLHSLAQAIVPSKRAATFIGKQEADTT